MHAVSPVLRTGQLSAVLDRGGLRWIRLGGQEIVRGIGLVVRDLNWEAIPTTVTDSVVVRHSDGLAISVDGHLRDRGIAFTFLTRISDRVDGSACSRRRGDP